MCTPSLNSVFCIWRLHKGVAHVILVPSLPKDPKYGTTIQNKIPGGGSDGAEESVDAGKREVEEELYLTMKQRCTPVFLMRNTDTKGHVKDAYAAPRELFRGKLRTKKIEDQDSVLFKPIEVPLDEAIRVVFQTPKNKFHLNALLSLKEYLSGRGINTDGPALTN